MATLSVATWNINSVRLRLGLVLHLAETERPDVICLQETKVETAGFPGAAFAEAGYVHQHVAGIKGYNGVAILSRVPFEARDGRHWCGRPDARHISVTFAGGIELHDFYVPSGGDLPDPVANDKFAHKLDFVAEMTAWFASERAPDRPMILVGDLNIAPLECDVWSHRQLLNVVSHTAVEVEGLTRFQGGLGWVDALRRFVPPPEKTYSWWSYRSRDWRASDRGRRLDHIWTTAPLADALRGARIVKDARGWEKPSDHVPVVAEFEIG